MGQTIDLCSYVPCSAGVGSEKGGGSQKVHHRYYQPTPPTQWSDSKTLDADKVMNLNHFQVKSQRKEKTERKKKTFNKPH